MIKIYLYGNIYIFYILYNILIETNFTKTNFKKEKNKLIEENFFIIDSNDLENVKTKMFGYSISKVGILTDNYYKQQDDYKDPEPQGVYVMIRNNGKEIIINQDFHGSIGLYIYENKNTGYFVLSNSFLLLEEYLVGRENLSFNKEYADNLIITYLCTFSIEDTLINEIKQIPSNAYIIINIPKRKFKINLIDYKENSIPIDSEKGLEIIDKWVDKWGYIIRSLIKQSDNISTDLSGGFDTRTLLSLVLNSGIDLNRVNINSVNNKLNDHDIDYKIASNISSKFGFKLNNLKLNGNGILWGVKNTLINTIYIKLGFHKQFYFKNKFYYEPIFNFAGSGGEDLRGTPSYPINDYIEKLIKSDVKGHEKEFYISSKRVINKSVSLLKEIKKYKYNNNCEITYDLYSIINDRNHFGKLGYESFMSNIYTIQPLLDPEIKRIKYDIKKGASHDLIAYIFVRFARDLINFPFQGNRVLDLESVKKAEKLNNKFHAYSKKSDFNPNFYIDKERKSPVVQSNENVNIKRFLKNIFKSLEYRKSLNIKYDNNVYSWANEYANKTSYFGLSNHFGLLAIAITLDKLYANKSNNERIPLIDLIKDNNNKFY